jgi:hypothetical protein
MKILVADRISPLGVEFLQKQDDFEVVEAYGSSPEELLEIAKDVSAIIVRSDTQITEEVIAGAPNLKAVGRAGVGVDNINIDAGHRSGGDCNEHSGRKYDCNRRVNLFPHAMWYPPNSPRSNQHEGRAMGKKTIKRS